MRSLHSINKRCCFKLSNALALESKLCQQRRLAAVLLTEWLRIGFYFTQCNTYNTDSPMPF